MEVSLLLITIPMVVGVLIVVMHGEYMEKKNELRSGRKVGILPLLMTMR